MSRMRTIFLPVLLFVVALTELASSQTTELLGAGATFPYPLYSKMFDVYSKEQKVRVNYQSIGSGGGIRQLTNQTVDFGASDAFMSDDELKKSDKEILHIPICMGAVVITYNLPGSPKIKLSPSILADIYLTKIKKWNNPAIAAINKGITLPNVNIIVVHRSDGSGTTAIFTDYLSKVSPDWKTSVGAEKSVRWPGGIGAKGNEGVAGMVKQIPGSIGYCELAYTVQNKMPQALIQNKSGNFVQPSIEATTKAADIEIPSDTRISITDTDSKEGYPISGFTWVLIFKEQNYNNRSQLKAKALQNLLYWMVRDGQKYAQPLDYAPLPASTVKKAETILNSITYDGKSLK